MNQHTLPLDDAPDIHLGIPDAYYDWQYARTLCGRGGVRAVKTHYWENVTCEMCQAIRADRIAEFNTSVFRRS